MHVVIAQPEPSLLVGPVTRRTDSLHASPDALPSRLLDFCIVSRT